MPDSALRKDDFDGGMRGRYASGSNLTLGTVGSGRFWAVHRHFGRTQMCDFDHWFGFAATRIGDGEAGRFLVAHPREYIRYLGEPE